MKGIAHFVSGVAIATCFPEVVHAAQQGSLLPVLGGVFGILPDTLDFKFARYFEHYDDEIELDAGHLDARMVAERIVAAMHNAYESGKPQSVQCHTLRLGADLWQQYTVAFSPTTNEVVVRMGPKVNTGQVPLPGSEPPGATEARVKVGVPMVHTYDSENKVDIFSGPSFMFERRDDQVYVNFLDWHRRWSHSLTLAAALGLGAAGVAALGKVLGGQPLGQAPLWAGLVVGLGFAGHVLEDQLGFMGSNLFYPFSKRRAMGAKLLRSGDALPNFLTVLGACALILFNLDRFSGAPLLDPGWYLGLALLAPVLLLGGYYQWQRLRKPAPRRERLLMVEKLRQGEMLAEAQELEVA